MCLKCSMALSPTQRSQLPCLAVPISLPAATPERPRAPLRGVQGFALPCADAGGELTDSERFAVRMTDCAAPSQPLANKQH